MDTFRKNAIKSAKFKSCSLVSSLLLASATAVKADEPIELGTIKVEQQKISDTQPIQGYKAPNSVTATRTDTPLIDIPQSVTVITKDVVKDLSIQSLTEASNYVPGIQSAQGEGNRDAIIFRGNASTSDFFVDGVRDDVQIYRDLYNTENLEVITGANGLVSGRGGAGGIVNRVTKQAGWDPIRELRTSVGSFGHKRTQVDVGQGLSESVAFRLNAVYEDSDSYRDGVDLERYGLAPTFTFLLSDMTTLRLSYEHFKDERIGDRGVPSVQGSDGSDLNNRPYDLDDYDQFFGNADLSPNESEVNAFSAFLEHDFGNGLTLKNSTRYAEYDKFYQNLYAGSSIKPDGSLSISSYFDETDRENFTNQTDLIYELNTGGIEHTLLASLELTEQDNVNRRLNASPSSFPVDVSNPIVPSNAVSAFDNVARDQTVDVSVVGLTLQDQIQFNEHWSAVVGFRYDEVDIDYNDIANNESVDIDDQLFSPRVGLIYKPFSNLSIYGNYSVTEVPRAGDQLVDLRGKIDQATFEPEKFINQEVGVKFDINPDLAFTLAAYQLDRENVVAADPDNPGNSILLDGQETRGIELGLAGKVTDKWQVFAAMTLQKGELTEDISSSVLKGSKLANLPTRSFSLWNKYQFNDVWSAGLGMISVSERLAATETTTATTVMPGYTRFDAAVFADLSKDLSLQLNIENLTDKAYAVHGHNTNNITPGAPLSARATLVYNF